jgi:hypothetical protein
LSVTGKFSFSTELLQIAWAPYSSSVSHLDGVWDHRYQTHFRACQGYSVQFC